MDRVEEYHQALERIQMFVQRHMRMFGDHPYISLATSVVRPWGEYGFFGMKRDELGRMVFCYSEGSLESKGEESYEISLEDLAVRLFYNEWRNADKTREKSNPQSLINRFLTTMESYISAEEKGVEGVSEADVKRYTDFRMQQLRELLITNNS